LGRCGNRGRSLQTLSRGRGEGEGEGEEGGPLQARPAVAPATPPANHGPARPGRGQAAAMRRLLIASSQDGRPFCQY